MSIIHISQGLSCLFHIHCPTHNSTDILKRYGELYKDNELVSTGLGDRIPINSIPSFSDTNLLEKIKLAIGLFDLKNSTIFKKVRFQNIDHGTYVVKVFRENPLFKDVKKFIGFGIVEVNDNSKTHIICSNEASIKFVIKDQEDNAVEGIYRCRLHF